MRLNMVSGVDGVSPSASTVGKRLPRDERSASRCAGGLLLLFACLPGTATAPPLRPRALRALRLRHAALQRFAARSSVAAHSLACLAPPARCLSRAAHSPPHCTAPRYAAPGVPAAFPPAYSAPYAARRAWCVLRRATAPSCFAGHYGGNARLL